MKRALTSLLTLASAALVAGCVGGTDPATHIRATQAQLNAHGHTNNGAATWWWEYAKSKAVVEQGNGSQGCGNPPEADKRCGPAETPNASDLDLSWVVTGLTKNTTYYFRACGQDTTSPKPACGAVLSFKTTPGDSMARVATVGGVKMLFFTAAPGTENELYIARKTGSDGVARLYLADIQLKSDLPPEAHSSIIPGVGCSVADAEQATDAEVTCPLAGISLISALLGDRRDIGEVSTTVPVGVLLNGEDGDDWLSGGNANDTLTGGSGTDTFRGGGGNDRIKAANNDLDGDINCGESPNDTDTAIADSVDDVSASPFGCEIVEH